MTFENVSKVRSTLPGLLRFFLQAIELSQAAGYLEVRRTFTSVASRVRQRKVVLCIKPVFEEGIDVVDIELALVENQVDRLVADETVAVLALVEPPFQLFSLFAIQSGKVARLPHIRTSNPQATRSLPSMFSQAGVLRA